MRNLNIPLAVYAVGVSSKWCKKAKQLFYQSFNKQNLVYVATRDKKSSGNLKDQLKISTNNICFDPGLLACKNYKLTPEKKKQDNVIGIGITAPDVLYKYSTKNQSPINWEVLYTDLAHKLSKEGYTVKFFTNGAPEDEKLKNILEDKLSKNLKIIFAPRMNKPHELVGCIANFDGLIAHRLHANIIAYSLQIPSVGMGWDDKLTSFFEGVNRKNFIIENNQISSEQIVNTLYEALKIGIDKKNHQEIITTTSEEIHNLAEILNNKITI